MTHSNYPKGFFVRQSAINRVRNPIEPPTECRYCGHPVALVRHAEIYGGREFGDWPFAYFCRSCKARVGLHPYTDIPLGILADADLRQAKKTEKAYFEQLRKSGGFKNRRKAYIWLARQLNLPLAQCHWGWFELERCRQAGAICRAALSRREEAA